MEAVVNTFSVNAVLFAAVSVLEAQRNPGVVMETANVQVLPAAPNISLPSPNISLPSAPNITLPSLFGEDTDFYGVLNPSPIGYTVTLTEEELYVLDIVRKVREECSPRTTLRVGGGWVRDKLLNRQQASPDIDFVLNNLSGAEFAQLVHQYLLEHGDTSTELELKEYKETQSQHLQTASLKIGDLWVDFNQLRFEKYQPHSRVPSQSGVASVVEDAFRRDLTINSLYYNLNTNQVEDWTEQGRRDLRLRTIRTPTAPLSTLLEDPLRILRAIRFSSQLSFGMDPALKEAAWDQRVKRSLEQKVSRERIGKEVDAIFQSADPRRGVQLLMETKLMDLIFPLDDEESPATIYEVGYEHLFHTQVLVSRLFTENDQWSEEKRRFLWYAAFFMPLEEERSILKSSSKAESMRSKLHALMAKGLRQPFKDVCAVKDVIDGARVIQRFLRVEDSSATLQSLDPRNDAIIAVVKEKKAANLRWLGYRILKRVGPHWRESLILALASSPTFAPLEAVDQYNELISGLKGHVGLSGRLLSLKPILNGKQVKKVLPGIQGPFFKDVLMAQERWQVEHNIDGSTAAGNQEIEEEVANYLRSTFPQFVQDTPVLSTTKTENEKNIVEACNRRVERTLEYGWDHTCPSPVFYDPKRLDANPIAVSVVTPPQ